MSRTIRYSTLNISEIKADVSYGLCRNKKHLRCSKVIKCLWQFCSNDEEKLLGKCYWHSTDATFTKRRKKEIAWRKKKMGGPVYPVNKKMGWSEEEGDFGKKHWMDYQQLILDEVIHDNNSI